MSNQLFNKKNQPVDHSLADFGGKKPPQAVELEWAVLGVVLNDPAAIDNVSGILKPEMFFKHENKIIYEAVLSLAAMKAQHDIHLVTNKLRKMGELDNVGGVAFIAQLVTKYAKKGSVSEYSRIIAHKWMLRSIILMAQDLERQAYEPDADPFMVIESCNRSVKDIEPGIEMIEKAEDLALQAMMDVEAVIRGDKKPIYLGFKDIDEEYAFDVGDLVLLGGKSGTGKTGFMMQVAKRVRKSRPDIPVVFNSLEMKGKKIISRDMASSLSISQMRFRTGNGIGIPEFAGMQKIIPSYAGIHFVQCWTAEQLGAKVRQIKKGLGLTELDPMIVVCDYAQIMKGEKGGNREQEVASISRGSKQLAEQENLVFILGSQLNKEAGKGRPTKSNLRESEALANDADWVILLYNPSKNEVMQYEDGSSTANVLEAIFDKVRFGKDGETVRLHMSNYGLVGDLGLGGGNAQNDELSLPKIQPNTKFFNEPSHSTEQPDIEDEIWGH